jgi:hypothetical protein
MGKATSFTTEYEVRDNDGSNAKWKPFGGLYVLLDSDGDYESIKSG